MTNLQQLRIHAEQIWQAGVDAVDSARLVMDALTVTQTGIAACGDEFPLRSGSRVLVVGAGKAGAGMAEGLEKAFSTILDRVEGFVNVPDDCLKPLERIHLHGARPAGLNEPTEAGVTGSQAIVDLIGGLREEDLCIVLISGGGSALLPAPRPGISLADKLTVTQLLMRSGRSIEELNCVRKHLSSLKGGGLVRQTKAGRVISLIISDVIGDPLDVIASGPTVADSTTVEDAIAILEPYGDAVPLSVQRVLRTGDAEDALDKSRVSNFVIGNNRTAMDASAVMARELGYEVHDLGSDNRGTAREVGRSIAESLLAAQSTIGLAQKPTCMLSGGEPIVELCDDPGKGGRNQELVVAALEVIKDSPDVVVLSGGTDGEDGPTDAAGGVVSAQTYASVKHCGLSIKTALNRNDAYPLLEATNSLLKTGPTHTNVMDLRVALCGRNSSDSSD